MTSIEQLFETPPYSLPKAEKQALLVDHLNLLSRHHVSSCEPYRKIRRASNTENRSFSRIDEFPYLPVRLFKDFDLKSIPDSEVIKTLTSSGTTGSQVSRIFLDKETSRFQTKALSCIVQDFIGKKRLPMLIIDSGNVIKDRRLFSARGAGILGMANFGYDHLYVLDDQMRLNLAPLQAFLEKHRTETILLFGFTFMIWQHFYREIAQSKLPVDLSHGILIHSGGWKKLGRGSGRSADFRRQTERSVRHKARAQFLRHGRAGRLGLYGMRAGTSACPDLFRYRYSRPAQLVVAQPR